MFGFALLFFVLPYAIGFVSLAFWRRWWTLLIATVTVVILFESPLIDRTPGDGPNAFVADAVPAMIGLGIATGLLTSIIANACRNRRWTGNIGRKIDGGALRPLATIVVVLGIGAGVPTSILLFHLAKHRWVMRSPGLSCIERQYPARIGNVDLSLPAAPGITIFEKVGYRSFGMWHNPDLRYLCSRGDGEKLEIRSLSFMVRQSFWSTPEAKDDFCSRPHPEYPWAQWVCDPKAGNLDLPDRPSSVAVKTIDPNPSSSKPKPLPDSPATTSTDGSKIYRSGDDVIVITPEGDRVECGRIAARDKNLYCSGDGSLPNGLAISYSFSTDGNGFERTIATMAAGARGYFRSVVQ